MSVTSTEPTAASASQPEQPDQPDQPDQPPRWLDADENVAWRAYLAGSRMLMEALDRDLESHGLSLGEYEIISMLSEAPGQRLRMSELAAIVVQSRSRLTHTAGRLENRGWVRRESCLRDRRGVELVLTERGAEQVLEVAQVHVQSVRRHLIDRLSPEQFQALGEAMAVVRDAVREPLCARAEADCPSA